MAKVENEITYGLNGAAFCLGIADPKELLWLVTQRLRFYGDKPYIPNGDNPLLIRFTVKQIEIIEKRLRGLSVEKLDSSTPAVRPHYKELSDAEEKEKS